jgi:positive regulator of sigma E activity
MRDKGLVVNTKEDMAQVEVQCFTDLCHRCSAKNLCIGQNQSKGLLMVRNPLRASPGDEVEVEVPDTKYSRYLIMLFGTLLVASLVGIGLGSLLSPVLPLSSSAASLLGLVFALIIAGVFLARYFRAKNKASLYPVIIYIIKKGVRHR